LLLKFVFLLMLFLFLIMFMFKYVTIPIFIFVTASVVLLVGFLRLNYSRFGGDIITISRVITAITALLVKMFVIYSRVVVEVCVGNADAIVVLVVVVVVIIVITSNFDIVDLIKKISLVMLLL